MKKTALCSAALVAALAGTVNAQITIDGQKDAAYGAIRWSQNVPTGFGDTVPDLTCDPNTLGGDPATVSTGVEFKIPLAALGTYGANVRICAFMNNSGHGGVSNQVLGGLPAKTAALGEPRDVNFGSISGDQFVTVATAASGAAATVDGTKDAAYGAALALQTNRTSAGNADSGVVDTANGSEFDGIYAYSDGTNLNVIITGNLNSDFSKLEFFIDNGSGAGYNKLAQGDTFPDVDFSSLQRMQGNNATNGLTFDAGFKATHYITFGLGGSPATFYPNLAELLTTTGNYLGSANPGTGGTLAGGTNTYGIAIDINNSNTGGVAAICPPAAGDVDIAGGSEIDGLFANISGGKLNLLVTGNLQTNFNKFSLLIDCQPGGQNVMRSDNPDIDFGTLNNGLGGLTFDAGFEADYWVSYQGGGSPIENYSNAAVLRTNGALRGFNDEALDYGAYSGGAKSTNNPVSYNGTNIDSQDGTKANIYTNYAPRKAGEAVVANPSAPVPPAAGLVKVSMNNSNIDGVSGDAVNCPSAVTTGMEFQIDLAELGWDGSSDIKVAGFITNGDRNFMSNQVIGGLPTGTGNLADPETLSFDTIDGNQYVVVNTPICASDFNGDGFLDFTDFDDFVAAFESGDCTSDFNGDGFLDFTDFDDFVAAFETGC
ncbi:MAG: hypothetical protein SFY96_09525 [Planctomycetota bacterium]|nr:hypothetical protein [Planctomycetota bacterium]